MYISGCLINNNNYENYNIFWLSWAFLAALRFPLTVVHGFLIVVTSLLQRTGSVAAAQGLSGSVARGLSPGQELNPYPPCWQVDSYPAQGSLRMIKSDPLCSLLPLSKASIPPDQVQASGNSQLPESRL